MLPSQSRQSWSQPVASVFSEAYSGTASTQQVGMVCGHLTAAHLKTKEASGGNSVLIACCDEAQVPALRLKGLQLPA